MDPNGIQGGMYSPMGSKMLGLEMSLHQPQPQPQPQPNQTPQNRCFLVQNPHPQTNPYHPHERNFRDTNLSFPANSKTQHFTKSDEDEDSTGEGNRKINSSPWQRMKWTDNMVRLLILVVYYIGDETEGTEVLGKKKVASSGAGGGLLLKQGKWKSVSRAMMERGFCVSPQQCEDKFNDLNKRYKRVNDILGKGTACRVVENQSLLDTMDNLTAKQKEEVKKSLNSKHLFFREMCAYHTSCASGTSVGVSGIHPSEPAEDPRAGQHYGCRHSSESTTFGTYPNRKDVEERKIAERGIREEDIDDNEEDEDTKDEDEDDNEDEECSKKRAKTGELANSTLIQQFSGEVASMVQDMSNSPVEKKQWVKKQMMQLEEKRLGLQLEAFELEKQRFKWLKFSNKKERDMEREKLQNERARLDNEKMLLLLRQKEFEIHG